MASSGTVQADRLEASLSRCRSTAEVADAALAAVQQQVPFSFACIATTDPLSGVLTWAYKSHPLEVGDEAFTEAEYGAPDVNQFAEIAERAVPVGVLSLDTDGHPERCRRFAEFLAPQFGFTDELRAVLGQPGLRWAALGLYRSGDEPDFTAEDAARVLALQAPIAVAIGRSLFADSSRTEDAAPPEPAVVIVDGNGRPRQMTRAARDRIDDLGGWDHGSLPAGLLAVAVSARAADGVFVSRTRLASGQWLTLRGSTLDGEGGVPDVVVTIELARAADMNRLTLMARGLTVREQEVVALVMKGASTKAIASALFLSPHTVQDHLKAIFAKTGVNSRRDLIGQLFD